MPMVLQKILISSLCLLGKEMGARGTTLHFENAYTETFNIVSMQAFTRQRPGTIKRLLRALVKAESFVATNVQESQWIMSEFSGMDKELIKSVWNNFEYNLLLKKNLLITLEDQARWAIDEGLTAPRGMPNFLDALYVDGLKAVKPEAVSL